MTTATTPKLVKVEVQILEKHFQQQPKPSSDVKRQLAHQIGVDLARINGWFQNRRAKAKQEKKRMEYAQAEAERAVRSRRPIVRAKL